MSHLDDLLAKWDALSKGETPTTNAVREAVAKDAARPSLCSQCGERPSVMVKVGTHDGWCEVCLDQAAETSQAARLAAVEALHVPWYEISGVRHDHTVLASGDDVPADHVCRIGPEHQACIRYGGDPAEDEHEVLACVECRQITTDGEIGYFFWPCPTKRALHPHLSTTTEPQEAHA